MSQKFLFKFTLDKEVQEKVTTTKVLEGKEVDVVETVKSYVPVELGLLKNSRRLTEKADLFFAKTVGFYTSEGLLSVHQINKRYYNDDGPFNKDESKVMENLTEQKGKLAEDYFNLNQVKEKTPEEENEEKGILDSILRIQKEIDAISNPYVGIFNQTAEYKARNKLITFWTVFLLHQKAEDGEWKRVVEGKDYEDGENRLFDLEDGDDSLSQEIVKKAMFYVSFWAGGGNWETDKGLKNAEEAYLTEFGDYLGRDIDTLFPVEKKVEKKVEDESEGKSGSETSSEPSGSGNEENEEGEKTPKPVEEIPAVPASEEGAGGSDNKQLPEDDTPKSVDS